MACAILQTNNGNNEESNGDRPASPNPVCPICLGDLRESTRPNTCNHMFCNFCIREWAKVKRECPLCKASFSGTLRTHETLGDLSLEPHQGSLEPLITSGFITALFAVQHFNLSHEIFRRYIYFRKVYASLAQPPVMRSRIFLNQPSQLQRLHPWLKRELYSIIPNEHVAGTVAIMDALQLYALDDQYFKFLVHQYLGPYSTHFNHELNMFSSSFLDIFGWDSSARYSGNFSSEAFHSITIVNLENDSSEVIYDPEVITLSDTENEVEIIREVGRRNNTPPVNLVELIDVSSLSSAAESSDTQIQVVITRESTRSRRCKRSERRRASSEQLSSDSENETNTNYEQARRKRHKSRSKRRDKSRWRRGASSSQTDNVPVMRSLRSVVVVVPPRV